MTTQNSEELFTQPEGISPELEEALRSQADEIAAQEEVFLDERAEFPPNKVAVGFHPLGGLGITVSDHAGESITARLSPPEVYQLVGNLTSLVGIIMMEGYMQQIAAQQEAAALQEQVTRGGIVLPGGKNGRR